MNRVIYRIIGHLAHVMNTSTGEIMTFEADEEDIQYLLTHSEEPGLGLDESVRELISAQGRTNTRLCRGSLNDLGSEFGFPTIVNLELNQRCSLHCVHCYLGDENVEGDLRGAVELMTVDEIRRFLADLKELGVFLIVLTGGEPFLNGRIEAIVDMAQEMGFVLELFSNLQYLPDWFTSSTPGENRIGRIQTSVYSCSPQIHDAVTTVSGSFRRTTTNLAKLKNRGYYVEVSTPLLAQSYSTWQETQRWFESLGIRQDFGWPIVNEYYGSHTRSDLNISDEEFCEFNLANPDFLLKTDFREGEQPICEAGRSMLSINANGDVFPCSQLPVPVGNITEQSIAEIYHGSGMQRFRDIKCADVGYSEAYGFCMGNNRSETGSLFRQPDFVLSAIRAYARIRKEVEAK